MRYQKMAFGRQDDVFLGMRIALKCQDRSHASVLQERKAKASFSCNVRHQHLLPSAPSKNRKHTPVMQISKDQTKAVASQLSCYYERTRRQSSLLKITVDAKIISTLWVKNKFLNRRMKVSTQQTFSLPRNYFLEPVVQISVQNPDIAQSLKQI